MNLKTLGATKQNIQYMFLIDHNTWIFNGGPYLQQSLTGILQKYVLRWNQFDVMNILALFFVIIAITICSALLVQRNTTSSRTSMSCLYDRYTTKWKSNQVMVYSEKTTPSSPTKDTKTDFCAGSTVNRV